MFGRASVFIFGVVSYAVFLATFLYALAFVGGFLVPTTLDGTPRMSFVPALAIDLGLLTLFALQHSVMARQGFKAWWTRIVPRQIERSTFVLLASLLLLFLFWQWRPMVGVIWSSEDRILSAALWTLFALGWGVALVSSVIIDHFDLFGVRQVYLYARGKPYTPPKFKVSLFYRYVRHPLLLGFMIAFWATPRMTVGHLLFAVVTTAYMLVAIRLEERDLVRFHGEAYEAYRRKTPMLFPWRG